MLTRLQQHRVIPVWLRRTSPKKVRQLARVTQQLEPGLAAGGASDSTRCCLRTFPAPHVWRQLEGKVAQQQHQGRPDLHQRQRLAHTGARALAEGQEGAQHLQQQPGQARPPTQGAAVHHPRACLPWDSRSTISWTAKQDPPPVPAAPRHPHLAGKAGSAALGTGHTAGAAVNAISAAVQR
jgi:hypothetical protein